KASDVIEQLRADIVVEPLGRQCLRRRREAVEHVVAERAIHVVVVEMHVDGNAIGESIGQAVGHEMAPMSSVERVATTSDRCGTSCEWGVWWKGWDAPRREPPLSSSAAWVNRESPHAVATTVSPSLRHKLRRDSGAMARTSLTMSRIASVGHAPA